MRHAAPGGVTRADTLTQEARGGIGGGWLTTIGTTNTPITMYNNTHAHGRRGKTIGMIDRPRGGAIPGPRAKSGMPRRFCTPQASGACPSNTTHDERGALGGILKKRELHIGEGEGCGAAVAGGIDDGGGVVFHKNTDIGLQTQSQAVFHCQLVRPEVPRCLKGIMLGLCWDYVGIMLGLCCERVYIHCAYVRNNNTQSIHTPSIHTPCIHTTRHPHTHLFQSIHPPFFIAICPTLNYKLPWLALRIHHWKIMRPDEIGGFATSCEDGGGGGGGGGGHVERRGSSASGLVRFEAKAALRRVSVLHRM